MKNGFTTGTCAQAAAKAAGRMLASQKMIRAIDVTTASGVTLKLRLVNRRIGKNFAECAVIKNSGEEPDVTHGAKIFARLQFSKKPGIRLKGGEGIGKVTKPGLAIPVGGWAINPVPRKMILKELAGVLQKGKGLEVTLHVPEGRRLARGTYNPRLGIRGGISILGTTGIVEPKSTKAYRSSLAVELNVLQAQGFERVVLVLGYVGEKYATKILKLKKDSILKIGDHVGFMLDQCRKKKIKEVLLIGHIGKLIKLTYGQFDTHCRCGDHRIKTLARYAENGGADQKLLRALWHQQTVEATIGMLEKAGLTSVFKKIAEDVSAAASARVKNEVKIKCILLSLQGTVCA